MDGVRQVGSKGLDIQEQRPEERYTDDRDSGMEDRELIVIEFIGGTLLLLATIGAGVDIDELSALLKRNTALIYQRVAEQLQKEKPNENRTTK